MKRLSQLALIGFFLFTNFLLYSCHEDRFDSDTELSIPEGYINFFVEDLLVGRDACNVKVAFHINRDWIMNVDYNNEESLWCHTSPSSGEAGLNKVIIQIDRNESGATRSAEVQLMVNGKKFAEIIVKQMNEDVTTDGEIVITPPDIIVIENFWKSEDNVVSAVAESYRLMTQSEFMHRLLAWGELRGDNVVKGCNIPTDVKNILDANILPSNSYASWGAFYEVINCCNLVLKYAPDVLNEDPNFTQSDLNIIRGEMLTIRALCHFYLIRTFRDIPMLTEAITDNSQEIYQTQATPISALEQCLQDLYEAENLVLTSGYYFTIQGNKGRITKNAVRAIIADILLWKAAFTQHETKDAEGLGCNQYYEECISYCNLIINDVLKREGYLSHTNYPMIYGTSAYEEIFGKQNSIESIFELQCTNEGNSTIPYFYGTEEGYGAILKASSFLSQINSKDTEGLYNQTDIRRANFVNATKTNESTLPITKYTAKAHTGTFSSSQPYLTPIYREVHNNSIESNWIIYRITDILLMKAEALAYRFQANETDLEEAFDIVSAVYYRSNLSRDISDDDRLQYPQNAKEMQALVLTERQRELAFEGKRWFDLVRMALRSESGTSKEMLDIMIKHKYSSNQEQYHVKMSTINSLFFPISERELQANPNLKQNEAYSSSDIYEKN